ncbi:MAG: hypothetical protein M3462_00670 [Chloroflexota bacterium]|nr:hypothetical protein [Chloroflexota bacterium]
MDRLRPARHADVTIVRNFRILLPATMPANPHATLDRAVQAAYGWDDPDQAAVPDDTTLARLLAMNLARAGAS